MNDKPKGDSILHALPPEQRARVDEWLFEENCPYLEVVKRCHEQFGLELGVSSVGRYYRREGPARTLQKMAGNAEAAKAINAAVGEKATDTYQALMNIAGELALAKVMEGGENLDMKTISGFARLLIAARREGHEGDRVRVEAERVCVEARRAATARERFEFDAAAACLRHQMEIQAILADRGLDGEAKIQAVRERLFGENLPG